MNPFSFRRMDGRLAVALVVSLLAGPSLPASSLALFETPRDRDVPVLAAIGRASKEVDVEVYELTDADVERALIAAHRAGRLVRVILNAHSAVGGEPNRPAFLELRAAGVDVRYSPPYFVYTHEKAIIVDAGRSGQEALIMTLNFGPGYLGKPGGLGLSLNFGVVDRAPTDVATVKRLFEADWAGAGLGKVVLPAGTRLVVSPINSESRLLGQIDGATTSFHFFAQELFDPRIVSALIAAARRGVDVKGLVASNFATDRRTGDLIKSAGGDVRILRQPYEHAKAAIADHRIVYIGSVNYSTNSMERNREVGILTDQPDIAAQMEAEFARFWAQGEEW
ncbi:MAG: phospholipase D-like domain-containing protein [Opitutaceae bacterium]